MRAELEEVCDVLAIAGERPSLGHVVRAAIKAGLPTVRGDEQ
ncbi:hypothetical protein BH11MYX4_BH11MYX4_41940 [soil metagenome]